MSSRFSPSVLATPAARLRLGSRSALLVMAIGLAGCGASTMAPATMLRGPALGDGSVMDVAPLAQGGRPVSVLNITPDNIAQFASNGAGASTGDNASVYRLGVGDVIQLFVVDEPELTQSTGYRVSEDGAIQIPYLGAVPVDGRSVAQIRDDLVTRLSRYRASPQVDVRVTEFNARHVAVVGDVRRPSRQGLSAQRYSAATCMRPSDQAPDRPKPQEGRAL